MDDPAAPWWLYRLVIGDQVLGLYREEERDAAVRHAREIAPRGTHPVTLTRRGGDGSYTVVLVVPGTAPR